MASIFDQKWLKKATPKSANNQPKQNVGLNVFWIVFWHRILIKNGSKKRPQNRARDDLLTTFLVLSSVSDFWEPQGSILGSFGPHFEAPELHFKSDFGTFFVFKCFNLEPCTSDIYSFRFCSFDKHILCLILSLPIDFRRSPSKQGRRWIAVRRFRKYN